MAEDYASRTEAPTPRRREEAREQGQVAYSAELSAALVLMAGILLLWFGATYLGRGLLWQTRTDLLRPIPRDASVEEAREVLAHLILSGLRLVGLPFGLLMLAGLAGSYGQIGFRPNVELLAVRWDRLVPFLRETPGPSWERLSRGLFALVKVLAVGGIAAWALWKLVPRIPGLGEGHVSEAAARAWHTVMVLAGALAGCLLLLGVIDYFLKLWRLERSLRMTRQELKEETKREEGDPLIKARIRRLQREAAQKKMYRDVRTATFVVTNPTHLAVALRYERGVMGAPRVVAKGAGFVAKRLVELARTSGVPVLERKPLAQALFRAVKISQEIPASLYLAVAEVLAYVYRLRGSMAA